MNLKFIGIITREDANKKLSKYYIWNKIIKIKLSWHYNKASDKWKKLKAHGVLFDIFKVQWKVVS